MPRSNRPAATSSFVEDERQARLPLDYAQMYSLSEPERLRLEKYYVFLCRNHPNAHNVYCRIEELVYPIDPNKVRRGLFAMLNLERFGATCEKINSGPHPHAVLKVYTAALANVEWNTGQVVLTREAIAKKAHVAPARVSTSMVILEEYGAIFRVRDGGRMVYFCNPAIGWVGGDKSKGMSKYQAIAVGMAERMKEADRAGRPQPPLPLHD